MKDIAVLNSRIIDLNVQITAASEKLGNLNLDLQPKQKEYDRLIGLKKKELQKSEEDVAGKQIELGEVTSKISKAAREHEATLARYQGELRKVEQTYRETHENLAVLQKQEVVKVQGIENREAEVKAQKERNEQEAERLKGVAAALDASSKNVKNDLVTVKALRSEVLENLAKIALETGRLTGLSRKAEKAQAESVQKLSEASAEISRLNVKISELSITTKERTDLNDSIEEYKEKVGANEKFKSQLDEEKIRLAVMARALSVQAAQLKQREDNVKVAEANVVSKSPAVAPEG